MRTVSAEYCPDSTAGNNAFTVCNWTKQAAHDGGAEMWRVYTGEWVHGRPFDHGQRLEADPG